MDGKTATFERTIELGAVSDVSVSSDSGNSSCGGQYGGFQNGPENAEIGDVAPVQHHPSVKPSKNVPETAQNYQNPAVLAVENLSEESETVTTDQSDSSVNCTRTSRSFDNVSQNSVSESSAPEVPVVIITDTGESYSNENCSKNPGSEVTKNTSDEDHGAQAVHSDKKCENLATKIPPVVSLPDSSGPKIPTVIVTSDSDGLTDDDIGIDKSVLNRLRYDSAGSGTSTELYATAYGYKSDYDSSCEDTEALYTAADWTEDSSADVRLDSNLPVIIYVDSSDCENSIENSADHISKSSSSSSISNHNPLDSIIPNVLIDGDSSRESGSAEECTNINNEISGATLCGLHDSEENPHQNACQSQRILVPTEFSERLPPSVGIVISREGSHQDQVGHEDAGSRESDVNILATVIDVHEINSGETIDVPVKHTEEVPFEAQQSSENWDLKNNTGRDILNGSRISLFIDEYSGTSTTKTRISVDLKLPDLPTCLNLSVEGVHIKDGNFEPNGNSSNSSYLILPLESPCGTEPCHDISRADVHSDSHVLDENALTLLQSAESRYTGEVSILKLQPLCNGGTNKISNNIKDKLAMRRRREDDREGDEAHEVLMGAGDRRGSDEVSVGSHFEIRGDEWNIALLLWLYLLQGIPLGLTAAIPMIIQNRGVSFKQQAEFSFAMWPFSLKLLWAPLVDAVYYPSFGRRKTWLVPAQYLIGIFMVFLSFHIDDWLSTDDPQVGLLTLLFFAMNFLAATQDIAVDGWALTMLKRQNRGLASMCNSVGQNAGFFLGYVVFIALESPEFCNKYLRSEPANDGLVTLPGFLYFWGTVYLIMTTLVAFIKREDAESRESPSVRAAFGSYHLLIRILRLPNIQLFAFLLLTCKMGFAAFDGVTSLKFIEKGVPKDKLALVAVPLVPLQILLPILITKMNHPRRPMDLFLKAFPYRLAFNFVGALFVYITPLIIHGNADVPYYYYLLLIAILAIHQGATSAMFVQMMAFFAMVSDADAGGTYMTLLNTLANLGGTWTSTSALAAVDSLTWRSCVGSNLTTTNDCANSFLQSNCKEAGGTCVTDIDGYYVEIAILTIVGIIWFWYGRKKIDYLQRRPLSTWAVPRR